MLFSVEEGNVKIKIHGGGGVIFFITEQGTTFFFVPPQFLFWETELKWGERVHIKEVGDLGYHGVGWARATGFSCVFRGI